MDDGSAEQIRFGETLRALRLRKGLTQEELASAASLDRTYISGCERGVRNVSLKNIYKLARALGVQPRDLLPPGAP